MNLSPLQKARYEYSPKLPGMLRGGISEISVKVGAPTESVADQEKIRALKNGYKPVSLGAARLRTETAAVVACCTCVLANE